MAIRVGSTIGVGKDWGEMGGSDQDGAGSGRGSRILVGPAIYAIRFESPWLAARFGEGRQSLDGRFALPLAEGSTTVFQTTASSDGLAWAKQHWYRYFGDMVAGELEAIIDGRFCVVKEGFPLTPIFMRNHPSFENNPDAQWVLIEVLT